MNRVLTIRQRLLVAALLPILVISTLLAAVVVVLTFDGIQSSFDQRNRLVVRQIALASEYGLFSSNKAQLQVLTNGALHESDVRWAVIVDQHGRILASTSDLHNAVLPPLSAVETHQFEPKSALDWLTQPVMSSNIPLDDLFEKNKVTEVSGANQLGQVVMAFSRQSVATDKRNVLLASGLIGLLSLLFGIGLAGYLSRGVLRPIVRVTNLIEHITQGDFVGVEHLRRQDAVKDPFLGLRHDIYRMADQLCAARDDLEQQVALATRALSQKRDEAEQANLAKSRFLAAASHDLRQPLHALGLFVSRLTELPHDAQTVDLITNLQASVNAMQDLLDGLLDVSRLEAGAVQVNVGAFALSVLFEQLSQDMAMAFRDKGLMLRVRSTPLWVMSDATLIYRILLNVVGNALRYTQRGGVLVVARHLPSAQLVRLQVWDSGMGIAPEHQQAVFAEYFQVGNPGRDRAKGLGLGLNIVQRTADLLGHPLALKSVLGRGTCISLDLPLATVQIRWPPEPESAPALLDEWQDQQVMVIEDDALARDALVGLLDSWGLQVLSSPDLAGALRHLAQGKVPAVIVSDYRLQEGVQGIEVVQHLRGQLRSQVPACLISGDTDPALILTAQAMGLTLLHKPVRPAKLRALLRRLLSESALQR
jgi:signal transduction histidine kinase/ActR/RegA family two-component response regulator